MQLVSGMVEFNACPVSLLCHNSFLVSLWNFSPPSYELSMDKWLKIKYSSFTLSFFQPVNRLQGRWSSLWSSPRTPLCEWQTSDHRCLLRPVWTGYYWKYVVILHILLKTIFMPPTRRVPEALCFRVVRPSVRPYGNLVNTKSQEPLGGFLSYLAQGCTMTSRWTD